jgi:hypothetical protein
MMNPAILQAPAPPAAQGTQGVTVVTPRELAGIPLTRQDVVALQARRSELSNQLNSAAGRRRDLARQLRSAEGADKAGLEQRMAVLDGHMARLETDIDETGRQLASSPALTASQQQPMPIGWGPGPRDRMGRAPLPVLILFVLFVLCPIALSISRILWKRASVSHPVVSSDTTQRLERMEQAMEAIAIEIERVSEGQRFVTRLLAEGRGAGTSSAQAMEPVRVPAGERSPI